MVETGVLFFSLLAVACQLFLLVLLLLRIAAFAGGKARRRWNDVADTLAPIAVPFAFTIALATMLGSLFMSEVAHYEPCHLCWLQRAALYPMVPVTALLWWKQLKALRILAFALAIVDIPISSYHYLVERYPSLESSVCDPAVPCTLLYVWKFHYLSIPLMALTSAFTMLTLLVLSLRAAGTSVGTDQGDN